MIRMPGFRGMFRLQQIAQTAKIGNSAGAPGPFRVLINHSNGVHMLFLLTGKRIDDELVPLSYLSLVVHGLSYLSYVGCITYVPREEHEQVKV
jgi:hypothetical protein